MLPPLAKGVILTISAINGLSGGVYGTAIGAVSGKQGLSPQGAAAGGAAGVLLAGGMTWFWIVTLIWLVKTFAGGKHRAKPVWFSC